MIWREYGQRVHVGFGAWGMRLLENCISLVMYVRESGSLRIWPPEEVGACPQGKIKACPQGKIKACPQGKSKACPQGKSKASPKTGLSGCTIGR